MKKVKITIEIVCESDTEYAIEEAYKKIICNTESYMFKKERIQE